MLREGPLRVPTCEDGPFDGDELGVDCGGSCARACPVVDVAALVEGAVAARASQVRIPPGVHRVGRTINVNDGRGILIDGTDARLVFTHRGTAFTVRTSAATLRGFTIDFDPLPFTQGRVRSVDRATRVVQVDLHAGYPAVNWFVGERQSFFLFNPTTFDWKRVGPIVSTSTVAKGTEDGRVAQLTVHPADIQYPEVGDLLVLVRRTSTPALQAVFGDGEVRYENVRLWGASGLAVYSQHWLGDSTLEWMTIERGPKPPGATAPRLMSTNMDALRWVTSRKGPKVYGAEIGWHGDDGLNFQGYPLDVLQVESPTSLVIRSVIPYLRPDFLFRSGDTLRLLRLSDLGLVDDAPIQSIERFLEAGEARLRVRLARAATGATVGQVADIAAHNSPGGLIRGCRFHNHRANAARVKGDRFTAQGNFIERVMGHGFAFLPHYNNMNWKESGWVWGAVLEHNVVRDLGPNGRYSGVYVNESDLTSPATVTSGS